LNHAVAKDADATWKYMTNWAASLAERASLPPSSVREALKLGPCGPRVGSIETSLAERMAAERLPLRKSPTGWHITGTPDDSLAELARWLNTHGLGGRWRDELLAVTDHAGRPVAVIERAAVRPLGITTHAVHLVVRTQEGEVWVQRRALDKATDPGLWDTTMGGLRSAAETVHDTLERETWEEAGLHLAQLQALVPHGRLTVRRPVQDPPQGYMVEHIDTFSAVLADGVVPANQDGEVAGFDCVSIDQLRWQLQQGRFTLEAALVLLRCIADLR
jgi:8-oxo-dGTP pyrophosphatase MutT (NUDIX family)